MKGVVFTEFLEMVEQTFSPQLADKLLDETELGSGGAYTAVGTYSHEELVALVIKLSEFTQIPTSVLIQTFGEHLFGRFAVGYPHFFAHIHSATDFLVSIENVIHVEVHKLYPDAQLPRFTVEERTPDRLVLIYSSPRGFGDLALGLIRACVAYYKENWRIQRMDLSGPTQVRFILERDDGKQ